MNLLVVKSFIYQNFLTHWNHTLVHDYTRVMFCSLFIKDTFIQQYKIQDKYLILLETNSPTNALLDSLKPICLYDFLVKPTIVLPFHVVSDELKQRVTRSSQQVKWLKCLLLWLFYFLYLAILHVFFFILCMYWWVEEMMLEQLSFFFLN